MRRTIVCWLAAATCFASLIGAQEKPAAEKPPENQVGGLRFIDVSEVIIKNVDVTVTTKGGTPVLNLRPQDFVVTQDGDPQEVVNFALYTTAGVARSEAATPVPPTATASTPARPPASEPEVQREPTYLVLYVDNENLTVFDRNRVINKMTDWVDEHLKAPDQMAVVSYQKSFKFQQGFTSSPEDIESALHGLKMYTGGRQEVISSRRDIEDAMDPTSGQRVDAESVLSRTRAWAREQRNALTFTVRALQDLISQMSGLQGKKAIVYLSDGLPMTPGEELYYQLQDVAQSPGIVAESRQFDATSLYRGLVIAAASAGVTLYTIDARGLHSDLGIEAENRQARSTLAASIAASNYQDSLMYMADQTGGLCVINTNDVTQGLENIAENFGTYYSLGYRLVPSGSDRPHRIEVEVKDHPEYRLNYSRTFIEKTLPTRVADRVMTGLAFDIDENPLEIEVASGEVAPAANDRWTLPVDVKIPLKNVALVPDGDDLVGYVMVYYAARDSEGKQSGLQTQEQAIKVPRKEYEEARGKYYTVTAKLLLDPGVYRICVGVRDELTNQAAYALLHKSVAPMSLR